MSQQPLTTAQISLRARIAALSLHSKTDGTAHTAPAREAFLERFQLEVDPDRQLPEAERLRRARIALRAHMARLALASSKARTSRAAGERS